MLLSRRRRQRHRRCTSPETGHFGQQPSWWRGSRSRLESMSRGLQVKMYIHVYVRAYMCITYYIYTHACSIRIYMSLFMYLFVVYTHIHIYI